MNDLIRRQDALDAIEERIKANGYVNVALISELNRLYGYIRQLPSAQPNIIETNVGDMISKQAAMHLKDLHGAIEDGILYVPLLEVINHLEALPPVHPDVSDRKVGKWIVVERHEHYPSGKPYEQVQCPFCKRFDNNGDGSFCGYCGAEMKGEEDGEGKDSDLSSR